MMNLILVATGGALGASLRHLANLAAARALGAAFPYGTLIVNVVGSLAMGLVIGWLAQKAPAAPGLKLFIATGILGGFTTFSAFSLDAVTLWERGATGAAALYVGASVVLSIAATFTGLALMRAA